MPKQKPDNVSQEEWDAIEDFHRRIGRKGALTLHQKIARGEVKLDDEDVPPVAAPEEQMDQKTQSSQKRTK